MAMRVLLTSTNRINNMVNYTIEEADAALETMTETILSEFNAACDKIDAEKYHLVSFDELKTRLNNIQDNARRE